MPPQRTQIACPRCRQPVSAQIEQLFDVTSDPGAKQRLLGGVSNYAACQSCGFSGPLSTPIVYHDADKELLLTFFPAELNMPVNEQEKLIGPLINQVTNRLPAEKRAMEVGVREGDAICGKEDIRSLQVRRKGGDQGQLDRPVRQLRGDRGRGLSVAP